MACASRVRASDNHGVVNLTPANVEFRPEGPGDEHAIARVVEAAFGERVVADLVAALRVSPDWIDGLSFVALVEGRIAGHIMFSRSLLDAPRRLVDVLVLSPVSVAPDLQGRGIGSALIRHGIEQVSRRAEPLVFLEGSPAFYGRFGFQPGGALGFRRPSLRIPEPAFQVIRQPSYEPWMTGTLVYSRVFWDLDCVGLRDEET
jgi:putative acetyltransferase